MNRLPVIVLIVVMSSARSPSSIVKSTSPFGGLVSSGCCWTSLSDIVPGGLVASPGAPGAAPGAPTPGGTGETGGAPAAGAPGGAAGTPGSAGCRMGGAATAGRAGRFGRTGAWADTSETNAIKETASAGSEVKSDRFKVIR